MQKLDIIEQVMITPRGKMLDGVDLVVQCPLWLTRSHVKRTCSKCRERQEVNLKEKYVMCKYEPKN